MLNVILYYFGKWERLLWVNNILTSKLYDRKSPKLKYFSINSRSLSIILIMGRKLVMVYYVMSYTWGEKRTTLLIGSQGCFLCPHVFLWFLFQKNIILKLILKAPSLELLNFLHLSHHQLALDLQRISGTKWKEKWNHCWDFSWTCLLTKVQWKMKEVTSYKWFLKTPFRKWMY